MAISTCAKCGSHFFELSETSPSGSNYKLFFVQCSVCGVPVATQEYYHLGTLIENQSKLIKNLEMKIRNIENQLYALQNQSKR